MLKTTFTLTVVSLALLLSNTISAHEMEYLGPHSPDPSSFVAGDEGVLKYNELCSAAFPGSQMCESIDVLRSGSTIQTDPDNNQWVKPTLLTSYINAQGEPVFVDASGKMFVGFEGLSCGGWTLRTTNEFGLNIGGLGDFRLASCQVELPVACCRASNKKNK